MDPLVVRRPLEDDRPEQLAGGCRRQLVRAELVGDAELLLRDEEDQAEQLLLDGRDRREDPVDRERVGRADHGVRGDPTQDRRRLRAPVQDLEDRRSSTPDTRWIVWR